MGISSTSFHGAVLKTKLLKVILIFGWFFLILSKISVGSLKGRMTSRCSGLDSGPPPIVRDEASWARCGGWGFEDESLSWSGNEKAVGGTHRT